MSHLNAPATRLLNVQCLICDTPLVDASSVEIGIGPVCRRKWYDAEIGNKVREAANALVAEATWAKHNDDIDKVLETAEALQALGLPKLAGRVRFKFIHLQLVVGSDGWVSLYTPYRRGFPNDLRVLISDAQKRRVNDAKNKFDHWEIHPDAKRALFLCLAKHFAGDRCYVDNNDTKTIIVPTLSEFEATYIVGAELRGNINREDAARYRALIKNGG
jgi:hypothetical protein